MLGRRMLQKANFPTFMGNSPVMDTINLTVPLQDQPGDLSQPCGVVPHFNCSSADVEIDFFSLWIDFFEECYGSKEYFRTPDASEGKLSYLYGQ